MKLVKATICKPQSTDAGDYHSMKKVDWGSKPLVHGTINGKALFVKGSEFIKIGGDAKVFVTNHDYMWGSFDLVEEC
jgi:hypothetical protein